MDHLLQNVSKSELKQYIDVIDHIRKKKRSKKQKVKAIEQQINYMNLMHNAGVQMSGRTNYLRSNVNSSFLSRFSKPDIDNLFTDLKIGKSRNFTDTLGNFQRTYSQLKYLDLIDSNNDNFEPIQSSRFDPSSVYNTNMFPYLPPAHKSKSKSKSRKRHRSDSEDNYQGLPKIHTGISSDEDENEQKNDPNVVRTSKTSSTDVQDLTKSDISDDEIGDDDNDNENSVQNLVSDDNNNENLVSEYSNATPGKSSGQNNNNNKSQGKRRAVRKKKQKARQREKNKEKNDTTGASINPDVVNVDVASTNDKPLSDAQLRKLQREERKKFIEKKIKWAKEHNMLHTKTGFTVTDIPDETDRLRFHQLTNAQKKKMLESFEQRIAMDKQPKQNNDSSYMI